MVLVAGKSKSMVPTSGEGLLAHHNNGGGYHNNGRGYHRVRQSKCASLSLSSSSYRPQNCHGGL